MSATWRIFIGLRLPAEHHATLLVLQPQVAAQTLRVRWIQPANWHITLHFLGDVAAEAVPQVQQALDVLLPTHAAPQLQLDRLGAFPSERRPNVIWAGVRGAVAATTALHTAAVQVGHAVGVPAERRAYHPHITLGYTRKDAMPPERTAIGQVLAATPVPPSQPLMYPEVVLFRSVLRREGAQYSAIQTWNLAARD